MAEWGYAKVYGDDYITRNWEAIRRIRKPVIAAVAGYALGGGCELAMACDMIIAADTAKFGQPEVTIGTMPGFGGTQRLPRAVGKAKAMDWCLTGRMIDAAEAERSGLVARVVPADELETEAMAVANKIASHSLPVILKIKESINRAYESSLAEGLLFERREFHATFALDDQKEGMRAFVEKRKPDVQASLTLSARSALRRRRAARGSVLRLRGDSPRPRRAHAGRPCRAIRRDSPSWSSRPA